jgi:hypothetical protein
LISAPVAFARDEAGRHIDGAAGEHFQFGGVLAPPASDIALPAIKGFLEVVCMVYSSGRQVRVGLVEAARQIWELLLYVRDQLHTRLTLATGEP